MVIHFVCGQVVSRPSWCVVSFSAYIHGGGVIMGVRVLLSVKGTVYPAPLLTLYLFTNCRPAASPGVVASSSLYRVGSLTGPITSVGHWHGHDLGSPLCQHASTMGGGAFPSPRIHAAPYLHLHIGADLIPVLGSHPTPVG